MKIVKLKGGLGNQMFQYAFAKVLAKSSGETVKLDLSTYNDIHGDSIRKPRILKFNTTLPLATDEDLKQICIMNHIGNPLSTIYRAKVAGEMIFNPHYFFERNRAYRQVEDIKKYYYFDGYWQSWQHVNAVIDELKKEFLPNYTLSLSTQKCIDKVIRENSVFIGIRKGDYTANPEHFGFFGQDYYDKALAYMDSLIENPVYYIFSNDISWVRENLNFGDRNIEYRQNEDVVDDFEELIIMMNCKHSIIINSTYHWWGARLHEGKNKIIVAPEKWFFDNKPIDIVPPHWVKIAV